MHGLHHVALPAAPVTAWADPIRDLPVVVHRVECVRWRCGAGFRDALTDRVSSALTRGRKYKPVDRANLTKALGEQLKCRKGIKKGLISRDCQIEAGRAAQARKMITGRLVKIGGRNYQLTLGVTDLLTVKNERSVSEDCWGCDGSCFVWTGKTWETGPPVPRYYRGDHQPAVCVDWKQARPFCRWAGARLPSEAEWEYATRSGGKNIQYPWGNAKANCAGGYGPRGQRMRQAPHMAGVLQAGGQHGPGAVRHGWQRMGVGGGPLAQKLQGRAVHRRRLELRLVGVQVAARRFGFLLRLGHACRDAISVQPGVAVQWVRFSLCQGRAEGVRRECKRRQGLSLTGPISRMQPSRIGLLRVKHSAPSPPPEVGHRGLNPLEKLMMSSSVV